MKGKILLLYGNSEYEKLFSDFGKVGYGMPKSVVKDPKSIKLVVFTGGSDVHPVYYNGKDPHNFSQTSPLRDEKELLVFKFCLKHGIKMTGICRGFQFLNVMCGGKMYQHISGHGLWGLHGIHPVNGDQEVNVTSTHHQLVQLPSDALPIAYATPRRSTIYVGPLGVQTDPPSHEIESAVFPDFLTMGAQYHPEMMMDHESGRKYYKRMTSDFLKMDVMDFSRKYGRKLDGRPKNLERREVRRQNNHSA